MSTLRPAPGGKMLMPDDDRRDRIEPTLSVPQGERRPTRILTPEEEVLKKLDRFIDSLGGNFAELTRDLRDSGFGPYALGTAKSLFDHFVAAVEATRRSPSAVHPWEEMRSLAERLSSDGEFVAAAEILEGLAKRSARHALPADFKARLETDRRASQERASGREAGAGPILMPELKIAPIGAGEFTAGPRSVGPMERSAGGKRLGLAAAGFAAAVLLAVGGNYALMSAGTGKAPSGGASEGAIAAASAVPDKKPAPAAAEEAKTDRTTRTADGATIRNVDTTKAPPVQFDAARPAPAPDTTQRTASVTATTHPYELAPVTGNPPATGTETAVRPAPSPSEALELNAASRVQKRLADLGYFTAAVDGVWGPRSRVALRDFKLANGLPPDETLDPRTRTVLFSVNARPVGSRGSVQANAGAGTAGTVVGAPPPPMNGDAIAGRRDMQEPPVASADSSPEQAGEPDWDPASQQAFNDFNSLAESDRYVMGSERLRGVGLGGGEGSIVGTWGRGAASCTVGDEPNRDMLWISRQTVSGAGRSCEVVEVRRSGPNWLIVGRCANGPTAYRFAVQGDRMIEFASGGTVYRRCEVRRSGISAAYYDQPTPPQEIGSRGYDGPRDYVGPREYEARETPPRDVGGGFSVGGGPVGGGGVAIGGSSIIGLPRR